MNVAERLLRGGNRLAVLVERSGAWPFVAFSLLYWPVTIYFASRKLMWNDELYTYYIARLPTMGEVWGALLAGGEQTPPFFYVITRLAFRLFGATALAMRVPEMLGFWVMSACLFVVVGRRTSRLAALCAAAFPLVTTSYAYAFEARPYGLVLGFAAVALLAWQSITLERNRTVWFVALAASLAATVSTHYYGVFVLIPLAGGEAARSLSRRRVDLAVWAAFALSVVPLVWHIPLLRAGQTYARSFWSPAEWRALPDYYSDLLVPAILPIAFVLILAGVHALVRGEPAPTAERVEKRAVPLPEIAAAFGFLAIPIVGIALGKLATGAFVNRYAVASVIGFALCAGYGVAMAFRRHPAMRLVVALSMGGWFVLSQAREAIRPTWRSVPVPAAGLVRPAEWVHNVADQSLPVVVAEPHTFTVLSHYGAPDLRSRLVYLADPELALKHLHHNSVERGMLDLLGPWFRMNVRHFAPFIAAHPRFLVYGNFMELSFLNWLLPELRARGMRTELLAQERDHLLVLVYRDNGGAGLSTSGEPTRTAVLPRTEQGHDPRP